MRRGSQEARQMIIIFRQWRITGVTIIFDPRKNEEE